MVNHGVSHACGTCKQRHKKCDEARPACNRCIKSGRICPGYRDDGGLVFRHFQPTDASNSFYVDQWFPKADTLLEGAALGIFLDGFIVTSADRLQSRGFLSGLQSLFKQADKESTIVLAAKLTALASIANSSKRKSVWEMVQARYGRLLRDYGASLSAETGCATVEQYFTAVLLGLFEIIVSNHKSPTRHLIHLRGINSIVRRGSPLTRKTIPPRQEAQAGVLGPPINGMRRQSLDSLIARLSPLTKEAERLLSNPLSWIEELIRLQERLLALSNDIARWADDLPDTWTPRLVGILWSKTGPAESCLYYSSGPVERYFDHYVATTWNCWRAIYLLCLDHFVCISKALGQVQEVPIYLKRARDLIVGLKSSVPYYLSRNVEEYVRQVNSGHAPIKSTRVAGGLLLLHPLYAAARCVIVPAADREYFIRTLRWIGSQMGIGQATLLADYAQSDLIQSSLPLRHKAPLIDILEGHYLITAGMLHDSA